MAWFKQIFCMSCLVANALTTITPCSNCDGNSVTCVDGACLPRCVSVTSSIECFQCRDSRFYGKQCELDCPDTCLNSRCQMDNTRVVCTEGCVAGKKGDNCGAPCPTACTQCERYGDGCTGPCQNPRFYGPHCRTPCSSSCTDGCNRITGECDSCEPGFTGDKCDVTCPPNCRDGCDKDTGECDSCEPGYRGKYCDSCEPGYRGKNCNDACPSSCRDGCDKEIGKCEGCNPGNSGEYCNVSCPITCREGCDQDGGCNETDMSTVGSILTSLAVTICIAVVACLILRRLKLKLKREAARSGPTPMNVNPAVSLDDISEASDGSTSNPLYEHAGALRNLPHIKMCPELQEDNSVTHMAQEFRNLPTPNNQSSHCGRLTENISKNRYQDILPFDTTRVCLTVENEEQSDYINASYIDGYGHQSEWIATQGPPSHLMLDFWRMIWQVEATKIVMLTRLVEAGFVKCDKYWPCCSMDCKTYGDVSVQCVEERVFEHYTTRQFAVWKANSQTRKINHLHYTSWPAHGVPDEVATLIDFYKVVKNTDADEEGPTVVHCSAGVGRTGTFLALGFLIEQSRYEGQACVFACVKGFRMQRMNMVNTPEQYILLYRALIGALQTRGILPDNCRPVWLQCQRCWNNVAHQPVCNGVLMRQVANRPANSYANQDAM
ncbi:receptor-type tyrosine-protein phosphatase T-like [Haliotis rufescens]|uniref:receptor-type tyrosine-protein phosphatase T-like n=1 Tax=Haliotis rufescens TaxID=6454 RepID=UPI00201F7E0D|nr:receptor-type tyrosine-protein phosphatase T-like [Haliotis rufescens]